jgi:hypothetical protein
MTRRLVTCPDCALIFQSAREVTFCPGCRKKVQPEAMAS